MEEKQNSLSIHSLIYGAGAGLAMIVITLMLYVLNLYMNQTLQYLGLVAMIAGMIIAALQYRKNQLKGFMTYKQAFSVSFLTGLFASILSVIFFFFYVKYINTGMIEELLQQVRIKMEVKAGNLSQDQMDSAMAMTQRFMTPVWMMIWGLVGNAFWSAVFALIIAIFIKKKDVNAQTMI